MRIAPWRWLIVGIAVICIGAALAAVRHHWNKGQREAREREPARVSEQAQSTAAVRMVTPSITPARRAIVDAQLPAFDPDQEVEVPFTRFVTQSGKARLLFLPRKLRSTLEIDGIGRVVFPRPGVPLKLVEMENGVRAIFFREMFSGGLYLYRVRAGIEQETYVKGAGDTELILREAVSFQGKLHAIVYDNQRGANDLLILDVAAAMAPVIQPRTAATLPSVEDPAGGTYEMIPTIFMLPGATELWVVGGTFVGRWVDGAFAAKGRLSGCIRAQEAVLGRDGLLILCLAQGTAPEPFKISVWKSGGHSGEERAASAGDGVPWRIAWRSGAPSHETARTPADLAALLRFDLEGNQVSGVMEFGSNNDEGRIPWSQIYFLNGLLDALQLARSDERVADALGGLAAEIKRRIDLELYVIERLMATPAGFRTKGFTVGRAPAIFAVQTGRLLLLYNRYRREIGNGAELASHTRLREAVLTLDGHIDVMRTAAPGQSAPQPGRRYLAWPKGSAFYFDGLNVPYNHQNEWAYAVFDSVAPAAARTPGEERALGQAADIIGFFLDDIAPGGEMPATGRWPYWWGKAKEGWAADEGVSVNKPAYGGDKILAWISFRSIDVMSVLAAAPTVEAARQEKLKHSIARLVAHGAVYPFVAASFLKGDTYPDLERRVALDYVRQTAPFDVQSSIWAAVSLIRGSAPQPSP